MNLDDVRGKLKSDKTLLDSLDGDQKLKDLLDQLKKLLADNQDSIDNIKRVIALTDSYDGYTSGGEDSKFFTGMSSNSKTLLKELERQNLVFEKLLQEVVTCMENVGT